MAARVFLQKRSLAPLATLALGGIMMAPSTVYAEAPTDSKRKPIYDDLALTPTNTAPNSTPKTQLFSAPAKDEEHRPKGPSPTDRLAVQIGNGRRFLYKYAVAAEDSLNNAMDCAFNLEQSFTNTIANLAPSQASGEKIMPGALYILVAAMAGSIVTRNRNVLLRVSAPLAFGVGAGWSVLPVTMRNVSDLAWQYERRMPVVAESHLRLRESIEKGFSFARVHSRLGVRMVEDKVTDVRETVEGWVKEGK